MKRLLKLSCKSTLVVMLVLALGSAAMAQRGQGGRGQFGNRPPMSPKDAQQDNLYEAMKVQNVPSMIHVEDLTADWHIITANSSGDYSYRSSNLFYTTGKVFLFGDQKFLVAYQLLDSSDPDQRAAQQYFLAQVGNEDSQRTTPQLLKSSQLTLSLFSLSQVQVFQEIGKFDPAKDIAAAPPQVLIDRRISQSNLKQIALAVFMYTQDYDEKLPPMVAARNADDIIGSLVMLHNSEITATTPLQNRLMPYLKSKEVFLQPTTHRPYLPNYKVSRLPDSKIDNPSQTFLFYEDAPDAEGKRNVAYADGHVASLMESQFQWRRKAQGISESGYPTAAKPTQKAKATPKA